MAKADKLSTEPYKGTRDFYPEDWAQMKWLMDVMRTTAERFGYVEYNASILEPAELYKAKTGEEIVSEQTYTFIDRGDREVTLRPEMTPTVARMVAAKRRDLAFPLRWYSIPNLFRYEQPQRGRLREHYQLNVDLFGAPGVEADIEIISLATQILEAFGATQQDYEVRINDRRFLSALFEQLGLNEDTKKKISKLADKKEKMPQEKWNMALAELVPEHASILEKIWNAKDMAETMAALPAGLAHSALKSIEELMLGLSALGIKNAVFAPSLMRGFDYYNGMIFEIFDKNPENRRALFGGGRYDNLLDIFGESPIPAVGFGMGDVTVRDFLEVRGLLPAYRSPIDLYICRVEGAGADFVNESAKKLRQNGLNVAVDLSERKVGAQIESASKQKIPFIVCLGKDEAENGTFKVKELESGEETELSIGEVPNFIKGKKN